jgi:hypothetical protein
MKQIYIPRKGIKNSKKVIGQIKEYLKSKGYPLPSGIYSDIWYQKLDFEWFKSAMEIKK